MPKVSAEHLEQRRDHILRVAAECFARDGFHATGMNDLILATGLSAGSMYRYFKNKDDLILAIIERYLFVLVTEFQRLSEGSDDPGEAVATAVTLVSRRLQQEAGGALVRLLPQVWAEAMRNDAIRTRGSQTYHTLLEFLAEVVRRGQRAGKAPPHLEPRSVANVMVSLVQGYVLQGLVLGEDIDPQAYARSVRALFGTVD